MFLGEGRGTIKALPTAANVLVVPWVAAPREILPGPVPVPQNFIEGFRLANPHV